MDVLLFYKILVFRANIWREREREKYSNYNEAAPELMRARRFKLPAMRYPMHSLQPFFMTSCSFVSFFSPRFSPLLHLSLLHPRVLYLLLFARLFTLLNKHPKKEHLLCCSRCLENSFGWTWAFRGSQTMFRVLMRRSPEHHSRHRTVCARWILGHDLCVRPGLSLKMRTRNSH